MIATTGGLNTYTWSTISVRSLIAASAHSASTWSTLSASGFSQNTCLPARNAAIARAKWDSAGVANATASSSGSARNVAKSAEQSAFG